MATTSTENASCEERDWSEVPQATLYLISKKLPDVINFIRFRAVWPRWRSSASVSDFRPQLFWFKYSLNLPRIMSISPECFPADSSRSTVIDCPELSSRMVIYLPWYSHMLVRNETNCSLSLLDPLTKREISLPPMNVSASEVCSCKILCLGSDHIGNVEYVVVLMVEENTSFTMLSFCEIGDDTWKTLEIKAYYSACTYYHGMFFVENKENRLFIEAIDVTTCSLQFVIPPPEDSIMTFGFNFFVESFEKLLAISFERFCCCVGNMVLACL